jgi:hypothetical protein
MKITKIQLRGIIRESLQDRLYGHPEEDMTGWREEDADEDWVEWTVFRGDGIGDLSGSARNFMQDWGWDPGESYGNVYEAWWRGEDPETAQDWIVVTDDGGYYKVGAKYMVWSRGWVKASWSYDHMEKQVEAAKADQDPPRDPGYQT